VPHAQSLRRDLQEADRRWKPESGRTRCPRIEKPDVAFLPDVGHVGVAEDDELGRAQTEKVETPPAEPQMDDRHVQEEEIQ